MYSVRFFFLLKVVKENLALNKKLQTGHFKHC